MKQWEKIISNKKKELLKSSYINAQMPDYIPFKFFEGGLPVGSMSMKIGTTIPYIKPQIVDEFVNHNKHKAIVIIKSQIDHNASRGMQFKWEGFLIDSEGNSKVVWQDNAYVAELKTGKTIDYDVMELIKSR